jgi:hypothetical protein
MSFSDPTTVDAGGHSATIEGRPLRGTPVRVTVDSNETTLPLTGDRKTIRKPHKFIAKYSNGASVIDKQHKQIVKLSNGTEIVRKQHKTVIRFSSGSKLVDKPHKTVFG